MNPIYRRSMVSVGRIVIRPRVQICVLVVVFAVFGLIGATYFTEREGDLLAGENLFGTILGCIFVPGSIVGMWRALRMGVLIDTDGIRIRGFDSRDHVTPWDDVQSIDSEQVDVRGGLPLFAPVIHSRGDIGAFAVRTLGSYSRSDAEHKAERLRNFMADGTRP